MFVAEWNYIPAERQNKVFDPEMSEKDQYLRKKVIV